MIQRFLVMFLSGILTATLLSNWTSVQAQSSDSSFTPTPIVIAFNPETDASTFRPSELKQSDQPTQRALIGEDNRFPVTTQAFPWSAMGVLYWVTPEDRILSHCSGTLIGKDLVLTNSHCLENPLLDQVVTPSIYQTISERLVFVPNMIEGNYVQQDVALATAEYVYGWESEVTLTGDWALLKLNKPLGEKYGYLGWRNLDLSDPSVLSSLQHEIRLAGYSADFPTDAQRSRWTLDGEAGQTAGVHVGCSIEAVTQDAIIHNCDTMSGASGSSMIALFEDGNYYIVGLHRGSVDLNPDSLPVNLQETCRRFDNSTGDIITVDACRNVSVQVSSWASQATTLRGGS